MAQCRWAIAFLPFRASRVNDKKVNEGNSNNKKVKTRRKTREAGRYVSNSLPLLDTTIARLQKNYKPFFEKTSKKGGGMRYFWHNAQIPGRFTGNLTKHETAGCFKQEHSKFL
jgi:Neuraminidase (sialidase)